MSKLAAFPFHWSVEDLVSHGNNAVYDLARNASGSLTPIKVLLGRCLLAMDELKLYEEFGMSSSVHFAMAALGHSRKEALTVKRVARELARLPLLTKEAESGAVPWSKLREVVSVATPETEELWLKLCQELPVGKIETLVSLTPKGGVPGELPSESGSHGQEYRCRFSPELVVMIERVLQQLSEIQGRPLSFAEAVERLFTQALIGKPYDEAEEKMKVEAQREFAAEQLAQDPLVRQAQDMARELGLVEDHQEDQDGCGCSKCSSAKSSQLGRRDQERELKGELLELALGGPVELANTSKTHAQQTSPHNRSQLGPAAPTTAQTQEITANPTQLGPTSALQNPDYGLAHQLLNRALAKLHFNPGNRLPTEAQRTALLRRDRYRCQCPGCPNTLWLQLHHVRWYSHGGETLPHNLITLCSSCHANVHAGHLNITGNLNNGLIFTDAEGRRLDRLHQMGRAGWLDYWIGWRGEEWESYSSKVA